MDADVGTMYIHILVVISAGSRVFSGTISHALTPAVVMIAHDLLILMHTQCLKNNSSRQIRFGFNHTYPTAVDHTIAKLYLCR